MERTSLTDPGKGTSLAERFVASRGDEYRLITTRSEPSANCRTHEQLVQDRQGRVGQVKEKYDCNGDPIMEVSTSCEWRAMNVHSHECMEQRMQFQYFWNVFTNRAQLQAPSSLTEPWPRNVPSVSANHNELTRS